MVIWPLSGKLTSQYTSNLFYTLIEWVSRIDLIYGHLGPTPSEIMLPGQQPDCWIKVVLPEGGLPLSYTKQKKNSDCLEIW